MMNWHLHFSFWFYKLFLFISYYIMFLPAWKTLFFNELVVIVIRKWNYIVVGTYCEWRESTDNVKNVN